MITPNKALIAMLISMWSADLITPISLGMFILFIYIWQKRIPKQIKARFE